MDSVLEPGTHLNLPGERSRAARGLHAVATRAHPRGGVITTESAVCLALYPEAWQSACTFCGQVATGLASCTGRCGAAACARCLGASAPVQRAQAKQSKWAWRRLHSS
jgi:hypothetical protein